MGQHLHQGQPVLKAGASLGQAKAAMLMLHGRGGSAEDILTLAAEFQTPEMAFVAPQAASGTWYPYPFLAPIERNEPWLSSALAVVKDTLDEIGKTGISAERTILLGFSQGACLTLEYAARNARRYGGVVGLTGGIIGPDGTPRNYMGSLESTPVFLGCSDVDFHIPKDRVHLTATVLERLGGQVTERLYPGMGHTVNRDEIEFVKGMIETMLRNSPAA